MGGGGPRMGLQQAGAPSSKSVHGGKKKGKRVATLWSGGKTTVPSISGRKKHPPPPKNPKPQTKKKED